MSNSKSTVFSQICKNINIDKFNTIVQKYSGAYKKYNTSAYTHLLTMIFAQLNCSPGLRSIENILMSQSNKLYHMGFGRCKNIARSTIAYLNITPTIDKKLISINKINSL